jgi:hypothetical protein
MRLASEVRPNELQRDDAIDQHVTSAIDDSHPAFTKLGLESVSSRYDFAEKRILRFLRA